jgi:hypothetical protein
MVSVEREDIRDSFMTIMRFKDGNHAQEIQVYVWEANAIETAIQSMSLAQVTALKNTVGKQTIKEW